MALDNFKEQFDNQYEEFFQKVLVAMKIANTRFQSDLSYGSSVRRVRYDISNVRVRTVTIGSDRTIDSVTDTDESLLINTQIGTTFALSTKEIKQAGPLKPGAVIGAKVAMKTAIAVDADVLYETINAFKTFDNGTLTTLTASTTPITLDSTTVPKVVTRLPAFLGRNNQTLVNLCWVVDHIASSDLSQYILGKNIDIANSVFQNGFINGEAAAAEVYLSENLTGQFLLTCSGNLSDGDTIVVEGVTLTAVSTIGATAGNFLIGANLTATLSNLAGLINNPGTTSSTQVALSAANQVKFEDDLNLTATPTATTLTVVGKGSGRMIVSKVSSVTTITSNFIHSYFGKKGAIDVVIQDKVDMEMRDEPRQRATNILSDVLYGKKTFWDGSQKFLDVWIAA